MRAPALDDPNYNPSFDALAHIVEKAHAAGLQVHAWINAMPIWRDEAPTKDVHHVFNLHGPAATGENRWLTSARDGRQTFPVGYFLDPGHPQAQNPLVSVHLDIVKRYDVDGIHFDYIRYPETDGPTLPRGSDVGYNPESIGRFQRATGRTDDPAPDDEAWIRWRRQQVTQLVRRISIEARAITPRIKVSAAAIAWGQPPVTPANFEKVSPMQRIFQNWQGWLAEGLLDLAVPMNYAREHDERVRGWFNGWIAWEKRYKADRQMAVGIGGYLSAPEGVLAQVTRVRLHEGRARVDGVSFFSHFSPSLRPIPSAATGAAVTQPAAGAAAAAQTRPAVAPAAPVPPTQAVEPDRLDFLVRGVGHVRPAFTAPAPAPVPAMPWIERPTQGFIAGTVVDAGAHAVEASTIRIRRTGWFRKTRRTTTDANGWFGMTRLSPGTYHLRLEDRGGKAGRERVEVIVKAGGVSRATLVLK